MSPPPDEPPDEPPDDAASGPAGSLPPEETRAYGGAPVRDGDATGPPSEDGRYTRDALLGRGGMGRVYLARDARLGRVVALKEAARGGDTAARLAREARVTAGLDHPGIVTVHDVGVTPDGRPFYTMRLVRGRPLSAVLTARATLAERLVLVRHYLDACNAVAYAHAEGVLHRDLKPANIMVGGFGETQVVDWGLATRIGETGPAPGGAGGGDPTETAAGAVLGTPAYMSPEQARGEPLGFASDVWSLGAVLYELLSGRRPRGAGTSDEVLARAKAGGVPSLDALGAAPAELIAIAEHALHPDVHARYPDAGALAADVAAWLDGRPVAAHRYSSWELLTRLVRAWRAPLAVAVAALIVVVGLVAAGTWSLAREGERVAAAEKEARAALATSDANLAEALVAEARGAMTSGSGAVAAVLASHAVALGDAPEAWGVLAGVATEARAERIEEAPLPTCTRHVLLGMDDVVCVTNGGAERVVGGRTRWSWSGESVDVRLEADRLLVHLPGARVLALDLAGGAATDVGRAFVVGGALWPVQPAAWGEADDALALNRLATRFCPGSALVTTAPDFGRGDRAVVCADGRVGIAHGAALPARYLATPATRDALDGVVAAEVTRDGSHLVLGGTRGVVAAIDLATGETHMQATAGRDGAWRLAVSADSTRVAIVGGRGEVEVRTLPELLPLARIPGGAATEARFAPDGTLLVLGGGNVRRWRLPSARAPNVLRGPDGITAAVFSPDGRSLATAHGRLEALVWDLAAGEARATLALGTGTAKAVAFTPDGAVAWFAMVGASAEAWRPEPLRVDGGAVARLPDVLFPSKVGGLPALTTRRIVVLRTGALVAATYERGVLFAIDTLTRRPLEPADCPASMWVDAAQSPDGGHAVLVDEGGHVTPLAPGPPVRCGAGFTIDGARSADVDGAGGLVVGLDGEVVRVDATGSTLWRAAFPDARVLDVAVSADGRWIAAGGSDHTARLWDATGRLRAVLAGHTGRVASVDFRADGRLLATGSWDGTARLWGLDVLDVPAATLDAGAPTEWGLTLAEALQAAH